MLRLLWVVWVQRIRPCRGHWPIEEDEHCRRCGALVLEGWQRLTVRDSVIHIYPLGDLVAHILDDPDDDCLCGTKTTPVVRADGGMAWLVEHYALDGRELLERGQMIPRELP